MAIFTLNQLHPTLEHGCITAWHKSVGDNLVIGDALFSVISNDATHVIMSPIGGELTGIISPTGSELTPDTAVVQIDEARPVLLGRHRHIEARVQQDRRKKVSAERLRKHMKD